MKSILAYIGIGIAIGGIGSFLVFGPSSFKTLLASVTSYTGIKDTRPYDAAITEDNERMFHDDDALYSYIKKFGPKKTVMHLHALSALYGSCHDTAHKAGRFAYELFEEKAFQQCGSECHSGCYHGATEAYFRDNGTDNLSARLGTLCNSELNTFFSHQCVHGIGHGLMAWTSYDLPEALKACDLLSMRQDSCWTGVFMENIVGGLVKDEVEKNSDADSAHYTEYLSDDPHFPCTAVEDKYKGSCYFLQTSRMMQLFASDFGKIAQSCAKASEPYLRSCFESMGRDVGGTHRNNPAAAIAACAKSPSSQFRLWCNNGAVQDSFWDPSGQDNALNYCALLTSPDEKTGCYETIFERAPQILLNKEALVSFCEKAEPAFIARCRQRVSSF